MRRAISPVLGSVILALIAVALAGILMTSVGTASLAHDPAFVTLSADASADGTVTLTHENGDPIHVDRITVTVTVDGTELATQPPVPFFSTAGFEPGPTGPFNSAADPEWTVGEQASFTVADTNTPTLEPGDEVLVELYEDGHPLAQARTTVS